VATWLGEEVAKSFNYHVVRRSDEKSFVERAIRRKGDEKSFVYHVVRRRGDEKVLSITWLGKISGSVVV
jgi:hypothetical protein